MTNPFESLYRHHVLKRYGAAAILSLGLCAPASAAAPTTIDALQWHRRILLVASPRADDPQAALQRRIVDGWARQAADRDLLVLTIAGDRVDGVADKAARLRTRYRLAPHRFQALLIGKDGHVAIRSSAPIDAGRLEGAIDAMPMRRAGQR